MAFKLKSTLLLAVLWARYTILTVIATVATYLEYLFDYASRALLGERYSKYPTSLHPTVTCKWLTDAMRAAGIIDARTRVEKFDSGSSISRGMCGKMIQANVSYGPVKNEKFSSLEHADSKTLNELMPPSSILIKTTRPVFASRKFEMIHVQSREALVYKIPNAILKTPDSSDWPVFSLPRAIFTKSRPWLAENVLVLEDIRKRSISIPESDSQLSAVTTSVCNLLGFTDWGEASEHHPDLPEIASTVQGRLMVLDTLFERAATMHGAHWCPVKGLKSRSRPETGCAFSNLPKQFQATFNLDQWIFDDQQDRWELAQASSFVLWQQVKKMTGLEPGFESQAPLLDLKFSPKLAEIIDKSFAYSTWENFKKEIGKRGRTFNHGDFHGANMMAQIVADKHLKHVEGQRWWNDFQVFLFDWSEAREWTPMADLGEILIADTDPSVFKHTRGLIQDYYTRLCKAIAAAGRAPSVEAAALNYPFESCWAEFCRAPVERWLFILLVFIKAKLGPTKGCQHFHDQLLHFIEAHGHYDGYLFVPPCTFMCP